VLRKTESEDLSVDTLKKEDSSNTSEIKLNNSNVIKNISYDQKEILYNIMQLYNNGEPYDCDITASSLKFYEVKKSDKYIIPEPKLLFDVYPQQEKIKQIKPFHKLPLEDNSIGSMVVDLPFVISPKTCASMKTDKDNSCLIARRFASFYPYQELYDTIYWFINECNRVLKDDGIVVWKMQDTISGSIFHNSVEFSKICAQDLGMYLIDEFFLIAKARLISSAKIKKQQHARKYTSSFLVIKKNKKLGEKFSPLKMLQFCKENVFEGKEYEFK
jgi:hypothetical protein